MPFKKLRSWVITQFLNSPYHIIRPILFVGQFPISKFGLSFLKCNTISILTGRWQHSLPTNSFLALSIPFTEYSRSLCVTFHDPSNGIVRWRPNDPHPLLFFVFIQKSYFLLNEKIRKFHFYFVCFYFIRKKGKSGRVMVRGKGRAATVAPTATAVVTAPWEACCSAARQEEGNPPYVRRRTQQSLSPRSALSLNSAIL